MVILAGTFKYLDGLFPCICIWAFKWDPYLPYPRGPDTEGREGKGPTCEYLLVPAPCIWAVLASGPLPLGRGPT